jgi:L-ascorbate metabolism protein UlaG (beta-lactamase superfamily)
MVITYYGEGCFRLQSGEASLLVDPTTARLKADLTLQTLSPAEGDSSPELISCAGEYESKGIEVRGAEVSGESTPKFVKTIFSVNFEDINFLFLGHLSGVPDPKVFEHLGEPDVVFVPVAEEHFLSPEDAAKVVRQFEPSIIIPSFNKNPDKFLKILGQKGEIQDKIVFKKKDLTGSQQVVVLKSQ